MSILIRGASVQGHAKDILIEGDRITRIAERLETAPSGADVIDARGRIATPSLANGHAHSAMTLLRGIAEDMELMPWLREAIWPREARLSPDDIYWGTRLAALEMIRTGTTVCHDMYLDAEAVARAARDSGMRFVVGYALIDGLDETKAAAQREACGRFFANLPEYGPRVRFALAAHSVYATCAESLRLLGNLSREKGLILHVHLAETEIEDQECRARTGLSPARYLDSLGALGPLTLAAHCLWLDEADWNLLAERGAAVVHNPVSNMKLASGPAFDYEAARSRGIRVILGTDGAASNNGLDLFADMKIAGLLQKQHYGNSRRFPVEEIVDAATRQGHEFLGTGAGRLAEGCAADLVLIDVNRPCMVPCHDLAANLVYAGAGAAVDTTICAGRVLMRGGRIEGEAEIIAEARARALALAAAG